jgi:uncharacterized protein YraI
MKTKRTKTRAVRLALAMLALAMTARTPAALALVATVMTNVHLRAGPSTFYPTVALLGSGSTVQVFGCEQGFNWCDVQIGPNRGWVDAAFLQAPSASGPVVVANSAVMLGIPTAPFVFNTYWGNYYRGRPWYVNRGHYFNYWHRFPHGVPPPPPRRPPMMRPPPPRPPPGMRPPPPRPPPGTRPPAQRPPPGTRPPSSGRPPPGGTQPPPQPRPNTAPSSGGGQ